MMKPRSLNSVKHRFRKVKSLCQLRKWKEQINRDGGRLKKLKEISSYTLEKFQESLEKGGAIHDIDNTRWAFKAQEKINLPGFTASSRWVRKFKRLHNIVSSKITKFITKNYSTKRTSRSRR